ncbi:histidine kinase [Tychonema bourrellyi FEM_GT703]|uniref:Histidine kinase n=1 Tax=Tychonema bourrellyi FEM_GT703 TaxID=2040638 RepID=A0A2G4F025_9CYAN|nr:ATP-binding protein [Tychonema bourrellyi]PHX55112.1 histidine kinase [Tychonema bourrellyi FEM_GT703]
MAKPLYTLNPQMFCDVFPFHIGFNHNLEIVQIGEVLQRTHQILLLGEPIDRHFQIHQPAIEFNFLTIQKKLKSLFILESRHNSLRLKGQMVALKEDQVILFICSVWTPDSSLLSKLAVKLKDFAIHDLTPDFLFLQQTSQTAIREVQSLTEELTKQKIQLQASLEVQKELTSLSQIQAQHLKQALSELQETQSQLIQAEKMSSLGLLVAGIAHEINNPVNFIHGNLKYLQEYVENLISLLHLYQKYYPQPSCEIEAEATIIDLIFLENDLPKILNSIKIGSERIRKIVNSLRNFSRHDEAEIKPVDIHSGIDSTLLILQHLLKANGEDPEIQVIKQYGELPLVKCYASAINQVFMNIISNGIDALRDAQKNCADWNKEPIIIIRTLVNDDRNLVVSIADNGLGMEQSVIDKIFDPFFTTKLVGKGTGLGLSISYAIVVEKHGGKLSCVSAIGEGTKFAIEISL